MRIKLLLVFFGCAILLSGCRWPMEPFNQTPSPGETVYFVPNNRKLIALTFDDGPNGTATEQILNALKERNVKATFFLIGMNAERCPETARRIAAEGHLLGIHTYSHPRFDQISAAEREQDIMKAGSAIEKITDLRTFWYRPPYGINGTNLTDVCRQQGLVVAGWSLDANDWNPHPVEELVEAIVGQASPGDIILLHDGQETRENFDRHLTVEAVPVVVDKLKEKGFVFVTLAELLRNSGAPVAVFENGVRLLGMQIPSKPVAQGGQFSARYFWDVPEGSGENAPKAFVHFLAENGKIGFQDDHRLPARGDVRDMVVRSSVRVPRNAPAGKYRVKAGLFYPDKPERESRLQARFNFPQSKRAVYVPAELKIVPGQAKEN